MNRYFCFYWAEYDADGGMNDLLCSYKSISECIHQVFCFVQTERDAGLTINVEIWDIVENRSVYSYEGLGVDFLKKYIDEKERKD